MAAGLGGCWCADNSDAGPFARVEEAIVFLMQLISCVFPGLRVWITQNGLLDCFLLSEISLAFFLHNAPSQIKPYQNYLVFEPDTTDWTFLDSDNQHLPSNVNAKTECCSLYTADYVLHMQSTYST